MPRRPASLILALCLVGSIFLVEAGSPVNAATAPLKCTTKKNQGKSFRYCAGLVKAKDGSVKLDTTVTLPPTGDGPYPVIVMLHGLGGSRLSFESKFPGQVGYDATKDTVAGTGGKFHYNNQWFASKGYAVMNYTVRGFEESACIEKETQSTDANAALYPDSPACLPQLVSTSHEVKDTQYLIGRLIDRTLLSASDVRFKVKKVGVTGVSYGGGHTWLLTRKNTWNSPKGTRIKLAAAAPIIGWTDIVEALMPNGVIHENHMPPLTVEARLQERMGVFKRSYADALYLLMGQTTSEPFVRPGYLKAWFEELSGPEPYDPAIASHALNSLLTKRSAYYVPTGDFRTPTLTVQGFTDDLFPAIQSVQMFNRLKAEDATYPVKMYVGDWGHPRAESDDPETAYISKLVGKWMGYYLKGAGTKPAANAEARTAVCGPEIGTLYRAGTWDELSDTSKLIALGGPSSLSSDATDPHAEPIDPVDPFTSDRSSCRVTNTVVPSGHAATEDAPLAADFTMLGLPEVTMTANPSVADLYVAARIWDVSADESTQTLVDRGVFRLGAAGEQLAHFRLNGNAYTFEAGHKIKVEFTANDAPAFKTSTTSGTVTISAVQVMIPEAAPGKIVP
jgi:predicted acyl esterase